MKSKQAEEMWRNIGNETERNLHELSVEDLEKEKNKIKDMLALFKSDKL